ncbi:MAG: acetamidase/formamidase family protein [Streptosporangiaceae bacterium]
MRRVSRDQVALFFDARLEPVIEVAAGERFVVETADSLCGLVKQEAPKGFAIDDVLARLGGACPVSGPVYVAGAVPGGVLEVHIEEVRPVPAAGEAWTGVFTGFGALSADAFSIQAPLEPATTLVPYDADAASLDLGGRTARIPLRPFLGTVGVAPARERRLSFSQSPEYLGDVDLPALTGGATLVLPVHAEGALLALGDAHAAQGDGEITGAAIEIEADAELRCVPRDAQEAGFTGLPQLNTASSIGSIAGLQGNDLTDCARAAYRDLVLRLTRHYGIGQREAYMLLGQVGRLQVGNMIDPFYSVLASIDRTYIS